MQHLIRLAAPLVLLGAATLASAQSGDRSWPGTKAGEATPPMPGVPAELARNLAKFDDLDFRVYTSSSGRTCTRRTPGMWWSTGRTAAPRRASTSTSKT